MLSTAFTIALALGAVASPTPPASELAAELNARALAALKSAPSDPPTSCTVETAHVRKEWSALTLDQRRDYMRAVKCLFTSPSKADPGWAPNARSRYDDFVAAHVEQTQTIHGTGNFLTWHRHYLFAFEKAVREECGYAGFQPYWDWFGYDGDLTNSTLFDGSDASLGGDGTYVAHNGTYLSFGNIWLPSGNGGGCVTTGPFKDITLNIGPIDPGQTNLERVSITDHNPRCLRRDLSSYGITKWMTPANLVNITTGPASASVALFQDELQGRNLVDPDFLGMHGAGHYAVGGDGTCIYSSVNEPLFWLHHGMVDRLYWIWQALHPNAAKTVDGLLVVGDPAAGPTTVDDVIYFGGNLGVRNQPIRELFDTLGGADGEYCYVYE